MLRSNELKVLYLCVCVYTTCTYNAAEEGEIKAPLTLPPPPQLVLCINAPSLNWETEADVDTRQGSEEEMM